MKVKKDYIKIENLEQYLIKVKQIHPDSPQYLPYWRQLKKNCIEGLWGYETGVYNNGIAGYRYMPGRLFFYGNFCTILDVDEQQNSRKRIRPDIRDIEWERAYMLLEARGFSGWTEDDEFTSDLAIKDPESIRSSNTTRYLQLFRKDGRLKEFINPRENIRKLHNEPKGVPTYWNSAKNINELGSRGGGKDLEENTLVYTDNGAVKIKDIQIGDKIFGADGKLTTVIQKRYFTDQLQYKITFADGRSIECGKGHLWTLIKKSGKKFTTELDNIKDNYQGYLRPNDKKDVKYFVQQTEPLQYSKKELLLEPYYLGLWLGDGNSHNTGITTQDKEIVDYIYKIAEKYNLHVQINQNESKSCPTYNINIAKGGRFKTNPLKDKLKKLNLIYNKHIPSIYKIASYEQKLELLKGLMDSDGYCDKTHIEITQKSKTLILDIKELCESLGIKTCLSNKIIDNTVYYRLLLKSKFPIFKLKRKQKYWEKEFTKYHFSKISKNGIVKIEPTLVKPSVCIAVDNKDSLFVAGDHIVTHNSYFYALAVTKYEITFDGVKYYTQENILNPLKAEICVGSGQQAKSADFMKKVYDSIQQLALDKDVGVWGKPGQEDYTPCPFYKEMAGSIKPNNKDNLYRHEYKVLENGREVIKGTGSYAAHVVYSINKPSGAEAAAGGRYNIVIYEEEGLTELLREAWGSNNATVTVGAKQFGTQIGLGTSGNMDTILPSKEIFTHPKQYNCVSYNDVWEESGEIGFFLPAYMTVRDFKDKDGNTDVDKALNHFYNKRKIAAEANNPHILQIEKMNYPLVPSDMWQSNKGAILPVQEAEQREKVLIKNKHYEKIGTNIKLYWDSSHPQGVRYTVEHNALPFYEHKYKYERTDLSGAIRIFEFPQVVNINNKSEIPKDMYWIAHDPYVSDNIEEGDSLGASYVFLNPKYITEGYNGNTIVASYIGKPYNGRKEYYQNLEKLIAFYGNPTRGLWFEANRGDECKNYFKNRNKEHLLCLRPERHNNSNIYHKQVTQYGFILGQRLSQRVDLLDKFRDWLVEDTMLSDGNKLNIERIPCIFLIRQIQAFNLDKGNYDAISAFLGIVLAIKETEHLLEQELINKNKTNPLAFLSQNKKIFHGQDY